MMLQLRNTLFRHLLSGRLFAVLALLAIFTWLPMTLMALGGPECMDTDCPCFGAKPGQCLTAKYIDGCIPDSAITSFKFIPDEDDDESCSFTPEAEETYVLDCGGLGPDRPNDGIVLRFIKIGDDCSGTPCNPDDPIYGTFPDRKYSNGKLIDELGGDLVKTIQKSEFKVIDFKPGEATIKYQTRNLVQPIRPSLCDTTINLDLVIENGGEPGLPAEIVVGAKNIDFNRIYQRDITAARPDCNCSPPSSSPTPSPSGDASSGPPSSAAPSGSGSASGSPSGSASASGSASGSPSGSASPSGSGSASPSGSASASLSLTPTGSQTFTPTGSQTFTPTGSQTFTPTGSPTFTPTGSPTFTPTGSPTFTPTGSPTFTPTYTPTYTPTTDPPCDDYGIDPLCCEDVAECLSQCPAYDPDECITPTPDPPCDDYGIDPLCCEDGVECLSQCPAYDPDECTPSTPPGPALNLVPTSESANNFALINGQAAIGPTIEVTQGNKSIGQQIPTDPLNVTLNIGQNNFSVSSLGLRKFSVPSGLPGR